MTTNDAPRQTLHPAWQFTGRGEVRAGVAETLRALAPAQWSELTTAAWFVGPQPDLDGASAAEWLTDGGSPAAVVAAARRDVENWNR